MAMPRTPPRPQLLKPKPVLQLIADGEERLWTRLDLSDSNELNIHTPDTGSQLLRHGKTVKSIHGYFGDLEPRKCCLQLTGCRTKFNSVRLVRNDGRDSGIEEGAMMKTPIDNSMRSTDLDETELRVFRFAYVCASLPVLGAPEPPSALSPSPVFTPIDTSKKFQFSGARRRSPTPHDSGVDDQDDTSIVPAETLRELLMRTFRLVPEKFHQYEQRIAQYYGNKQAEKILAEELVGQLAALENNNNPFYCPDTFMNTQGYDKWQRREFAHIGDLMKKFWHFTYPQPSTSHIRSLRTIHQDYITLMEKLIRYESPYRLEGELSAPGPTSPLSSASLRLLKEFGLRYGIRELYRKIVYLHYLSKNFDPTVWFIQHTSAVLTSVVDALPKMGAHIVLVKKEHALLVDCVHALQTQAINTLTKMKCLFPSNRPSDGLESLIELLSQTLLTKAYLTRQRLETLQSFLLKQVQNIFPVCYSEHKMVVVSDLGLTSPEQLSPTLLNMMIGKIRDEVKEYKIHYQGSFEKYFHITREAAQSLYTLLMDDVKWLCQLRQNTDMEIDKLMLGLGYRLNQLDQDWSSHLTPQMQTWREVFVNEELHWSVVLKVRLQHLVVRSVSLDQFKTEQYDDLQSCPGSSIGSFPSLNTRHRTISTKSITPSINSAFSGLISSAQSTPVHQKPLSLTSDGGIHYPTIPESPTPQRPSGHVQEQRRSKTESVNMQKFSQIEPMCDPHTRYGSYGMDADTQSLDDYVEEYGDGLTFSYMRQSSSLPDILSKSYDHRLSVSRKYISQHLSEKDQSESEKMSHDQHSGQSRGDMTSYDQPTNQSQGDRTSHDQPTNQSQGDMTSHDQHASQSQGHMTSHDQHTSQLQGHMTSHDQHTSQLQGHIASHDQHTSPHDQHTSQSQGHMTSHDQPTNQSQGHITSHDQHTDQSQGHITSHDQHTNQSQGHITSHDQHTDQSHGHMTSHDQSTSQSQGLMTSHDQHTSQSQGHMTSHDQPTNQSQGHITSHDQPTSQSQGHIASHDQHTSQSQGHIASHDQPTNQTQGHITSHDQPTDQSQGHKHPHLVVHADVHKQLEEHTLMKSTEGIHDDDEDSILGEFSNGSDHTLTDSGDEDLTEHSESPDEDFAFPPIEIVSMVSDKLNSDVPVTSGPDSQAEKEDPIAASYKEMNRTTERNRPRIVLDRHTSHESEESQGPMTPMTSVSSAKVTWPGSMGISVLPLSSSVVDLIVMLQRLVGFSQTISQTFCHTSATHQAFPNDNSSFTSSLYSLVDFPVNAIQMMEARQKLYDNVFEGMCNTLCVFADNMLCMDLCGTTLTVARKLVGPQLVAYLQTQRTGGLIWGCRHDTHRVKDCFRYVHRKTNLLCDRYEPVRQDMCTRINNVSAALDFLQSYHAKLGRAFDVYNDLLIRQKKHTPTSHLLNSHDRAEYDFVGRFSYNPEVDRQVVMETASQITSTTTSSYGSHSVIVQSATRPCQDHLMAVLRALSRIMAYRINLFVYDALRVLLGIRRPDDPIHVCLQPLTQFLQTYFDSLQAWLYPDCFRRVTECIWIFIVQDFEEEVNQLMSGDANVETSARTLIQALSHLLAFITHQDKDMRKDLLLSQAEDVMFKLQLFTESTPQLMRLYFGLKEHNVWTDASSTCTLDGAIHNMLYKIRRELQLYTKCFSGQQLTDWIMANPAPFCNVWDEVSVEDIRTKRTNCTAIAQWLMDQGLLVDMESELQSQFETSLNHPADRWNSSTESFDLDYPALSIHSSMPTSGRVSALSVSDKSPGSTPCQTPVGSPSGPFAMRFDPTASKGPTSANNAPLPRSRPHSRLLQHNRSRKGTPLPRFENLSVFDDEQYLFRRMEDDPNDVNRYGLGVSTHEFLLSDEHERRESRGYGTCSTGLFTPHIDSMLASRLFQDNTAHYYYITTLMDSILHPRASSSKLNVPGELKTLIEQCFQKKIGPDYVVTILYTRRKNDKSAKVFTQKVLEDPDCDLVISKSSATCVTS